MDYQFKKRAKSANLALAGTAAGAYFAASCQISAEAPRMAAFLP